MSHNRHHKVGKGHRRNPGYLRALAVASLLGASCNPHPANAPAGTDAADSARPVPPPPPSPSVAASAVVSRAPVAPAPSTGATADVDLTVGAPKVFPEDLSKIPDVRCGVWCPPQYQVGEPSGCACPAQWQFKLDLKDAEQIEARLRYCFQAAVHKGINTGNKGRLRVFVHVDEKGRAGKVESDDSTGVVPRTVVACAEALVTKIRFKTSHKYKRVAIGEVHLPFDPKVH